MIAHTGGPDTDKTSKEGTVVLVRVRAAQHVLDEPAIEVFAHPRLILLRDEVVVQILHDPFRGRKLLRTLMKR